jgi:uncharacterized membrane protein YraQ (UPF0718 family)
MAFILNLLIGILAECWEILVESAPFVLFGFFMAGMLKEFLPLEAVSRHMGRNKTSSVLKASLFGIPLPLCSCGVIPAAVGLRKQGASKGATSAFLISVPETGVDSVAITWALLDPAMTVIRPIASFITATCTGIWINQLPEKLPEGHREMVPENGNCGCSATAASCCGTISPQKSQSPGVRLRSGLHYAFYELFADLGKWLLLGIAIAGVIAYGVPDDFFLRHLNNGFVSLLVMLGIGIPLYICASASTPVAAALVLKGLSPGAALVFLLAGPATNAATLTVVSRYLGKAATVVYVLSIAVCSLLFGWLTNAFYAWAGLDITRWVSDLGSATESPWMVAFAIVLVLLLARCYLPRRTVAKSCCSHNTEPEKL